MGGTSTGFNFDGWAEEITNHLYMWYYVENGERRGPVDQTTLDGLVQQGSIGGDTLVWREGMSDWQTYNDAAAVNAGGPAVAAPVMTLPRTTVACSRCGEHFSADQVIRIEGANVCHRCKPLVLQSLQEGILTTNSQAEAIRNEHIRHEASVKSIGILYFLAAAVLVLAGSISMFVGRAPEAVMGLVFVALGVLQLFVGIGLRKLRPWARIAGAVLSGIGLLGFPIGTLINGYILYLLLSKKGSMVFSEPYQQVIVATPHIKYRTSIVLWILLGILLLVLLLGMFGVFLGGSRVRRLQPSRGEAPPVPSQQVVTLAGPV